MELARALYLSKPETVLSSVSLLLLLVAAWRPNSGRFISYASIAALFAAIVFAAGYLGDAVISKGVSVYDGLYRADGFGSFSMILIFGAAAISLLISPKYLEERASMRAEYPILIMLACVGMAIMASANDLLTLYVGLELNSLAAYVLASFSRADERSAEAGLKYFVLGALASGILLFGMSLIYGFTGSTGFEQIGTVMGHGKASIGLVFGIVFMLSGLAFKLSAAPFHMWTPDVYEGSPTPVTAFFASAPKVAATALTIRIVTTAFAGQVVVWQQIIIVIALMSIIIGAIGAIGQKNIKRLLAYSSINNIGFILIGLAAANQAGVAAMLTYLAIYVAMTLGSFICVMQLRDYSGMLVEGVDDVAGLSITRPALAAMLAIFMFSLAGIPPLFGFWGKLVVFQAAVSANLLPLAVIGIAASVIGAFYYLKIVKLMYFDEPVGLIVAENDRTLSVLAGLMALLVSPLGYFLVPMLSHWTTIAAKALF
jgi:NADH-quinone oxidoreductase subunit N